MKFAFPVAYSQKGRLRGKKVAREYRFSEIVDVEISEVGTDEAPVAVSWRAPRDSAITSWQDLPLLCAGHDGRRFTRWYGGRHWIALFEGNLDPLTRSGDRAFLSAPVLADALGAGDGHPAVGMEAYAPRRSKTLTARPVPDDPASMFEELRTDGDRDNAMQAAARLADRLLVVDGTVHLACAQPAIRVPLFAEAMNDYRGAETFPVDTRASYVDGIDGYLGSRLYYPVNEWDEVVNGRADRSPHPPSIRAFLEPYRPRVFLPHSLGEGIDQRRKADNNVKRFLRLSPEAAPKESYRYFRIGQRARMEWLETVLAENRARWESAEAPHHLLREALDLLADNTPVQVQLKGPTTSW